MNKTVKTIAWICLVLGLLGTAVTVGIYVRGRAFIAQHQAAIEAGEIPAFREWDDAAADNDRYFDRDDQFKRGGMFDGGRGNNTYLNDRGGNIRGGMRGGGLERGGFVLPFLFLASGPVLMVVGAVMLIVNREPKVVTEKVKKEKSKKK